MMNAHSFFNRMKRAVAEFQKVFWKRFLAGQNTTAARLNFRGKLQKVFRDFEIASRTGRRGSSEF
jgi:hypothetical protein